MKTVHRVAGYFVRDAADHGQRIRHMKLLRRCYYSARFDSYGSRPIPPAAASAPRGLLRASDAKFLDLGVARLDGYHDWDLSHATQQDDP